jgi:Tol biopolymer transport system component
MPAWAARRPLLVYVTDRNGSQEIWIQSGAADRPVVTPRDFPPGTTKQLAAPALSPEADRIVYGRVEANTPRLWISAAAGGTPIPLTNERANEWPGSWSPDGRWFAYRRVSAGRVELMKVKTTGQAAPVALKTDASGQIPSWSPTGEWIAFGGELISPDGKITRPLGNHGSAHYMFSANGKLVYGIRPDGDRNLLFSVDIVSGAEKIIRDLGAGFRPGSSLNPGVRFSLAPDDKGFVYARSKTKNNLWLLEGFAAKTGLLARLGLR